MDPAFDIILILMGVAFLAATIDAMAGGGGLVTIPALLAAGIPPVTALATNKLQSSFGTCGAVIAFARRGHIDFRRFALPALASFIGSAGGAFLVTRIDSGFLSALLPMLLVAMVLYFLFSPRMSDEDRHSRFGPLALIVTAAIIGGYDGFFGPGTGSFFTTALVGLFGLGLIRAVAHTKLLNFASNFSSVIVFIIGGHVLWITGLAMAVGSIAGGQFGAYLAIRFGAGIARPLLIVMSLALTTKLLLDPANPLTAAALGWFGG
ncbi:putative membrane protein YfcA [Sphingobium sp. B2D3A]|uniref:TSUP family transporter n=1 Tax=unclassified Sphingobium TaxID=2611147 RepID=UPI00222579B1|nr:MULTISPECIES: TSUP family transporter [unclassified Sphingobium]MCW2338794.1 putative membrane protein YfcA [Sphingobium sp. B2D3A]MCW2338823.1 putative membrane protein YfcA [Sphingobium sp. B2D3A]MCW2385250.1 putative membrane protein YfcA [Sphingobium sp. B2D3D]